jgi:protein involved in polysaccharide export with SLBB domain
MLKTAVMACLLVAAMGCSSGNVTYLTPAKFVKRFALQTPSETGTNATDLNLKTRLIAPGMLIHVSVDQDHSLDKDYTVPANGTVEFQAAGRMNCLGLTTDELAQKIRAILERDYFQTATVEVSIEAMPGSSSNGGGGGVVYVIGNVNRPGPLLLPKDEAFTVTKVIIAAGNFAAFANGSKVRLIRYDENGHKYECAVDVAGIMKAGDFDKDVPVQNGDWIIVPEKMFSF